MKRKNLKNLAKLIPAFMLVIAIVLVGLPKSDNGIQLKAGAANKGVYMQASNLNIDFSEECSPITEPKQKTILLYFVGSNLESQGACASIDMVEIMDASVDIDKCNVVVFTGGANGWHLNIPSENNCMYLMTRSDGENTFTPVLMTNQYLDMADPTTLEFFLNTAYYSFPAEEYDLILWDHGGAVTGFGIDEITGNLMGISGIGSALENSPFNGNKKLEWIAFDACLMAGLETAHVLKDHAKYLIASEEDMDSSGFDYSFMNRVANERLNGAEAGKIITDTAYAFLVDRAEYGEKDYTNEFTMSCIDLSKTDAVEEALEFLSRKASDRMGSLFNEYSAFRANLFEYGLGEFDSDTIDCISFASFWKNDFLEESDRLTRAVAEAVSYNVAKREISNGLSLYNTYSAENSVFSLENVSDIYKYINVCPDYLDFMYRFKNTYENGGNVDWDMSDTFVSTATTESSTADVTTTGTTVVTERSTTEAADNNTTESNTGYSSTFEPDQGITRISSYSQSTTRPTTTIPETTASTMQNSTTTVPENENHAQNSFGNHDIEYTLSSEQAASVAKVHKLVLSELGGYGGYTCVYSSDEVNIQGNTITADFDGDVYSLSSNGTTIPVNLYEIQRVGNERIFEAQVLACRTAKFDLSYAAPFCLRIVFSDAYPNGKITGMRPLNIERGYAPVEIKDGYSFMTMDTGYKGITYDKNGHIKPLGQWEEVYPATSKNSLTVKNGLSLMRRPVSDSQYYMCLYIRDTHGYGFMTDLVKIKK